MASFQKLSELLHAHLSLPGVHLYFIRHGQSLANHAGSIVGWTDSKLSIKGREQANRLFRGLHVHASKFTHLHSSDLVRCTDTLNLSLGFPSRAVNVDRRLRELNFGDDEGVHFDSLPEEQKKRVNSFDYQAPNGENWKEARQRAMEYLSQLAAGHHLVYTHGGLMCTLTYELGLKEVVPNCSVVAVEMNPQKRQLERLHFKWIY